jgi:hypothetical protein
MLEILLKTHGLDSFLDSPDGSVLLVGL